MATPEEVDALPIGAVKVLAAAGNPLAIKVISRLEEVVAQAGVVDANAVGAEDDTEL